MAETEHGVSLPEALACENIYLVLRSLHCYQLVIHHSTDCCSLCATIYREAKFSSLEGQRGMLKLSQTTCSHAVMQPI